MHLRLTETDGPRNRGASLDPLALKVRTHFSRQGSGGFRLHALIYAY